MKKIITLWAILLFIGVEFAVGQTNINAIRFGSTGDPLNGLTIGWKSSGTADKISWGYTSSLEMGEFSGLMSSTIMGTQFDYTFPTVTASSTIHYKIYDSNVGEWTNELTFETASNAPNDKFRFTVLGDSRSYPDQWKIMAEAAFDTDFTLFMGDIIADGGTASDWPPWFEYGDKFVSREPIYHCLGNHDDDSSPSGADNFMGLYTLPGNELYYSFNYGNALFICLNSQKSSDPIQYNWLLNTLEENKGQTWKFVFFHKPFYTSPTHVGEMDAYFDTWWKAFDDYGVDMTFHGHTHNYQRTKPINRNVSTNSAVEAYGSGEGMGRCQIVAGSTGPSSPAGDPNLWWMDNSEGKRHFLDLAVDGNKLTMLALDANHVVFDSLTLDKVNSDVRFEVDMNEVTDLYDGGAVWLAFGARDSVFEMTDTDGDNIYTYSMTLPIETELKYYFSYQTGADPSVDFNEETVPAECSDAEGYRFLTLPASGLTLPAFYYGTCYEAPQYISFQVDLAKVTDLYDGGAVWLAFGARDSVVEMDDVYGDSIYSVTVPLQAGTNLQYYFSYQNGSDPGVNYVDETVLAECSNAEGYRELRVPEEYLTLPAVLFGDCDIDKGPGPTISIPLTNGNDDAEEFTADVLDDAGNVEEHKGKVGVTSSDLELCNEDGPQLVGMIFRNVQIPVGAIITNAYIQFVADDDNNEAITVDFFGAAVANVTAAFTGADFEISAYPQTTARVEWNPDPWTAAEIGVADSEVTRSPDISSVLSEIIAIDGWAPGNGMLLMAQDPDQVAKMHREAESANGSGGTVLNVFYVVYPASVDPGNEFSNTIYPNPTEGLINIMNPSTDDFSYEIYSISGKLVSSKHNIFGQTTEVDMSGLLKGMYIINVRSEERSVKHKVILQ